MRGSRGESAGRGPRLLNPGSAARYDWTRRGDTVTTCSGSVTQLPRETYITQRVAWFVTPKRKKSQNRNTPRRQV